MKKLKLIFNIYFVICICYASYDFYKITRDYFKDDTTKTEQQKKETKSTTVEPVTININKPKPININKPKPILTKIETTYNYYNYHYKDDIIKIETKPIVFETTTVNIKKPILTKIETNYNYRYNSELTLDENSFSIQDSNEFNLYKKDYNLILNKYFNYKHLKGIKEIIITNSKTLKDGNIGLTKSFNEISYIIIAAKSRNKNCIIHEAIHAMYFYYLDLFNTQYKTEWLKEKKFVSEYAKTNIMEDIAETGTAYLTGNIKQCNYKIKLFKQFYNQILEL